MMTLTQRLLMALVGALLLVAVAIVFTARGDRPGSAANHAPTAPSGRPAPPRPPLIDAPDRGVLGTDKTIPTASLFEQIRTTVGDAGTETDGVLTIRLPRSDLFVLLDGNEIPAAAGVRHELMFHRCPCGTMLAHGQFLLLDYEVNDVIDALRQDPEMKIVGTSRFLLGSDPALTVLRYQAEGDAAHLAAILKSALRWVGEARTRIEQ